MRSCRVSGGVGELTGFEVNILLSKYGEFSKHTNVRHICRECGYFGPDWGQSVIGHWHFRCYFCGNVYSPWKIVAGKSVYNRILAIEDPVKNHVQVIPALWPESIEENWLAGMAETFARQIKRPEDLEAYAAKTAVDIQQLVAQAGNPSFYQKFQFPKEAQWKFQAPKWPLEKFEHVVKDGLIGQIWRPEDWKDRKVFNSWPELAQLLGNMIAIGEQLERSS